MWRAAPRWCLDPARSPWDVQGACDMVHGCVQPAVRSSSEAQDRGRLRHKGEPHSVRRPLDSKSVQSHQEHNGEGAMGPQQCHGQSQREREFLEQRGGASQSQARQIRQKKAGQLHLEWFVC